MILKELKIFLEEIGKTNILKRWLNVYQKYDESREIGLDYFLIQLDSTMLDDLYSEVPSDKWEDFKRFWADKKIKNHENFLKYILINENPWIELKASADIKDNIKKIIELSKLIFKLEHKDSSERIFMSIISIFCCLEENNDATEWNKNNIIETKKRYARNLYNFLFSHLICIKRDLLRFIEYLKFFDDELIFIKYWENSIKNNFFLERYLDKLYQIFSETKESNAEDIKNELRFQVTIKGNTYSLEDEKIEIPVFFFLTAIKKVKATLNIQSKTGRYFYLNNYEDKPYSNTSYIDIELDTDQKEKNIKLIINDKEIKVNIKYDIQWIDFSNFISYKIANSYEDFINNIKNREISNNCSILELFDIELEYLGNRLKFMNNNLELPSYSFIRKKDYIESTMCIKLKREYFKDFHKKEDFLISMPIELNIDTKDENIIFRTDEGEKVLRINKEGLRWIYIEPSIEVGQFKLISDIEKEFNFKLPIKKNFEDDIKYSITTDDNLLISSSEIKDNEIKIKGKFKGIKDLYLNKKDIESNIFIDFEGYGKIETKLIYKNNLTFINIGFDEQSIDIKTDNGSKGLIEIYEDKKLKKSIIDSELRYKIEPSVNGKEIVVLYEKNKIFEQKFLFCAWNKERLANEVEKLKVKNKKFKKKYIFLVIILLILILLAILLSKQLSIATITFNALTPVLCISFSPDGKYIASGSKDYTIKLWDINSGYIKTFEGHKGYVTSVCFSPDGKYIASGSSDGRIKLWDINSRNEVKTFKGHTYYVSSVCFSPDGKYIASGGSDNTIKLWDINSGNEVKTFAGHTNSVYSVCFSPDGKYIASGSSDCRIKLWNINSGNEVKTFAGHTDSVRSVCFSPDGKYIASGGYDNTIKLWDINSGNNVKTFEGHTDRVNSVCFSPDGKYIASGSFDNTIKLWDINSGNEVKTFEGHTHYVTSVCFSPDGKYIASGSVDKTIKVWDIENIRIARLIRINLIYFFIISNFLSVIFYFFYKNNINNCINKRNEKIKLLNENGSIKLNFSKFTNLIDEKIEDTQKNHLKLSC